MSTTHDVALLVSYETRNGVPCVVLTRTTYDKMLRTSAELLEALKDFLKYSEGTADTSSKCVEVEDAARAAIAKATA